jgi:hypothetical protein
VGLTTGVLVADTDLELVRELEPDREGVSLTEDVEDKDLLSVGDLVMLGVRVRVRLMDGRSLPVAEGSEVSLGELVVDSVGVRDREEYSDGVMDTVTEMEAVLLGVLDWVREMVGVMVGVAVRDAERVGVSGFHTITHTRPTGKRALRQPTHT